MNRLLIFVMILLAACNSEKEYAEHYPNGKLKESGIFIDGKKSGAWIKYDSLGRKLSMRRYSEDTLKFREFYIKETLFSQEEMNGESVKHGKTIVYYENGIIKSESNYSYGKKIGVAQTYYPNGQLKSKYSTLENGETTELHQYYPNGELMVYAKNAQNGEYNIYDSLGNRTIDLLMENSVVVDTLKVY